MYLNTNKKNMLSYAFFWLSWVKIVLRIIYDTVEHLCHYKSKGKSLRIFKTNRDNKHATKT